MIYKLKSKIKIAINQFFRSFINSKNRKRLKNKNFTLISSNCNGCLILHDLGIKYNSPFVNLFIRADDYIRLLQNFDEYMSLNLNFIQNTEGTYPVALLGDVLIHFVHYKNEQEAAEKWKTRKERMNMSNCYVLFTDRDGCDQKHLKAFDALPFEHKIVFTHTQYEDIQSAYYIKGFEEYESVGNLHKYKGWLGQKYYDDFDYVSWFNVSS